MLTIKIQEDGQVRSVHGEGLQSKLCRKRVNAIHGAGFQSKLCRKRVNANQIEKNRNQCVILHLVINKFPKSVNLFLIDLRHKVNYVTLKKIYMQLSTILFISICKIWGQLNDHLEKSYFRLPLSFNNSKPNFRLFKHINKEILRQLEENGVNIKNLKMEMLLLPHNIEL